MSWSLFRKEMHPVVKFAIASAPGECDMSYVLNKSQPFDAVLTHNWINTGTVT